MQIMAVVAYFDMHGEKKPSVRSRKEGEGKKRSKAVYLKTQIQ